MIKDFLIKEIEGEYRTGTVYGGEIILCKHVSMRGERCDGQSSEYGDSIAVICNICKIQFIVQELIN